MAKSGDIHVNVTIHYSVCEHHCAPAVHDYPSPTVRVQKYQCGTCNSVSYIYSDPNTARPYGLPDPYSEPSCVVKSGHNWYETEGYYR